MPVPKPVTLIIPNYLPHKERAKRKIVEETATKTEQIVIKHATVEELEENFNKSSDVDGESLEPCAADISVIKSEMVQVLKPKSVKIINCEPEKPKQEQRCKKHSRCHCDLLSLETTDFFTIKV